MNTLRRKKMLIKRHLLFLYGVCSLLFVSAGETKPDSTIFTTAKSLVDKEKVPLEITGFSEYRHSSYALFLHEENTENSIYLPIIIGDCEALSLSRELAKVDIGRPLTYQLFGNLLDSVQISLKEVIITGLRNNTFYSVLVFTQGEKRWVIDARPSDAMNLAVRLHCKIYAYREVIEQAGQQIED